VVPQSAVHTDEGKPAIFVVREGKVERRAVSLGPSHGSDVDVMAGVSAGDSVVIKGADTLRDGQAVEVKQ
jgi:membrane fusion protein (multidrug efflux system)